MLTNRLTAEKIAEERIHGVSTKALGFWIYLMSDCVLFAVLFATYAIFSKSYVTGPTAHDIFNLKNVFIETLCLLVSSFFCGMAIISMHHRKRLSLLFWLSLTIAFGCLFVLMEINEFYHLIVSGRGPDVSAFLSSYFTLVGTHGAHVSCGLIWALMMLFQIMIKGLNVITTTRLVLFSLFWHFLDIIWIAIFTFVYLMGML